MKMLTDECDKIERLDYKQRDKYYNPNLHWNMEKKMHGKMKKRCIGGGGGYEDDDRVN